MNEDKKKIILSVIGILLLIGAVFGITYAFWAYARTGSQNNQITSGKLMIKYEEGDNNINITEQYPVSDAAAVQKTPFAFTVSGYVTGDSVVNYTVYAVLGDEITTRTRMRDYEVKIKLTAATTGSVPVSECISVKNNYDSSFGNIVGASGSLKNTDSLVLATGYISSHDTGVTETHTYSLTMWIPDSVVSVGDVSSTNGTTSVYSSADFENLYYSMKINVKANAQ